MTNRIRIKMGPIEFEAEGDNELIEREREQFFKLLPQAITAVTPVVADVRQLSEAAKDVIDLDSNSGLPAVDGKTGLNQYESIAALLKEKKFVSILDQALGIAYYIDQIQGNSPFSAKDIDMGFSNARVTKPSNTSDVINKNIAKGFILEDEVKKDGKKAFRISQSGITWFKNFQAPETSFPKPTKVTKPRSNKKNVESQLLNFSLDELNLEKYCDLSSLESIRDQVFVVTYIYTIEKKVDYFTYEDIVSILKNKFNVSITHRQVKYVFENVGTLFDKKNEGHKVSYKMMASGIKEAARINSENIKSA